MTAQTRQPRTRWPTGGRAAARPAGPQPHAELGLTDAEYARITRILGRRPTDAELAIYSVMWSEHCSYKSSRRAPAAVRREGAADRARCWPASAQNAGVVDIGQGYAVTFKIESHNHPSYVEPFQGAATGVGGIVRDILAMGARPVAVMDALRFGPADAPDTRRVLPGVVGGISFYGNCLGLPNIGGELAFDPCYAGNPLVNALCVGVMRHEDLKLAAADGAGQQGHPVRRRGPVRDGIGGASVLASASFGGAGEGSEAAERPGRRPVHGEAADRVLPGAVRGRAWSSASRISARPAWPAPPPSWPRAAAAGMRVRPGRGAAARRRRSARPRS